MGCINLYKIDGDKQQSFFQEIANKMRVCDTIEEERPRNNGQAETFRFTLYISEPQEGKELPWKWVLDTFHERSIERSSAPKGVIVIEKEDNIVYAVTFGHAYFIVDKFCDRDFGFNFARKLSYKEIKTTTLTSPNSHRNKTVNTYIDYSELEFDSGESFAKLKAKVDIPENFVLYKPSIEVGSSIRFTTAEDSLTRILDLILHAENVLANTQDICRIPVFSKIKDIELQSRLNDQMLESIRDNPAQINISELDIIGATEIFNHNDEEFTLKYREQEQTVTSLSNDVIEAFCRQNNWNYGEVLLDIYVIRRYNGDPVSTNKIRELIDYTNDEEKCLLSKGVWYKYNEDYLRYLQDSIAEIPVEYHPEYDFTEEIYSQYIEQKYAIEKMHPEYQGKEEGAIKNSLKRKYYAERVFNLLREEQDDYHNFDRRPYQVGGTTVECMDLFKDGMMCAVKIGKSSSKLCYAVDQSLTALKLYKKKCLENIPEISTVVLWFVLEGHNHIEDASGKPDLNRLQMLLLKNRLDQWKKDVRLQGFKPMIYINYRSE